MLANIVIFLSISTLIFLLVTGRSKSFILLFFLSLSILPPFRFSETYISASYFLLPLTLLPFGTQRLTVPKLTLTYLATGSVIILISLLGWGVNAKFQSDIVIPVLGQSAHLILVAYIVIYHNKTSHDRPDRVIRAFVKYLTIVNLVAILAQIYLPKISIPFFHELYWTPSLTVLDNYMRHFETYGWIPRPVGLYGSPVNLGVTMLLCWAMYVSELTTRFSKSTLAWLTAILIAGSLSLSKTFIIGAPIILALNLIVSGRFANFMTISLVAVALTILAYIGYSILLKTYVGPYVEYYYSYLTSPFDVLKSRYTADSEADLFLLHTYQVIKENILLGVGPGSLEGEFIGDSLYVTLLHHAGILGAAIFTFFIAVLVVSMIQSRATKMLVILGAVLLVSLGTLTFYFSTELIPFIFLIINFRHGRLVNYSRNGDI